MSKVKALECRRAKGMRRHCLKLALLALGTCAVPALANLEDSQLRGSYVSEAGMHMYSGSDEASLSGARGYQIGFGAYSGRGTWRWGFLSEVGYAGGNLRYQEE